MWGCGLRPHPHIRRFISSRVGIFSMLPEPGRLWGLQAMTYPWAVSVGETRVLGKSLDRLVQAPAAAVGIIT